VECPLETAEESRLGCDKETVEMNEVGLGMAEEMVAEMLEEMWQGVQTYLVVKPESGVRQEQHEPSHSDKSPQWPIATSLSIHCVGMGTPEQAAVVLCVLVNASYGGEEKE
jgi:hypothetical protein